MAVNKKNLADSIAEIEYRYKNKNNKKDFKEKEDVKNSGFLFRSV